MKAYKLERTYEKSYLQRIRLQIRYIQYVYKYNLVLNNLKRFARALVDCLFD